MNKFLQLNKNMNVSSAAQEPDCNNAVLLGIATAPGKKKKKKKNKKCRNAMPEFVTNRKPRYLPNLKELVFNRGYIDVDAIVMSTLSPLEHRHDPEAAAQLQDVHCRVFDLPRNLFPRHSPLNKITYLPPQLLPGEFEAGGVFPPGVLAHKYYPNGLLQQHHRGPTPPLFVGRRRVERHNLHRSLPYTCAAYVGMPLSQIPVPVPVSVSVPVSVPVPVPNNGAPSNNSNNNKKNNYNNNNAQLHPDLSVGYIIAHADSLAKVDRFAHQQTQYRIYVPDLSTVPMMVHFKTKLCMTVLSDVVHPHESDVAFAVMRESPTKFQLPQEYFSMEAGSIKRAPVFLPHRYLPPGFEAGCVFGPGTLPESLFEGLLRDAPPQMQRNVAIMPPVFIGMWKEQVTPSVFIFPQQSFMVNMAPASPTPIQVPPAQLSVLDELKMARKELKPLPKLFELEQKLNFPDSQMQKRQNDERQTDEQEDDEEDDLDEELEEEQEEEEDEEEEEEEEETEDIGEEEFEFEEEYLEESLEELDEDELTQHNEPSDDNEDDRSTTPFYNDGDDGEDDRDTTPFDGCAKEAGGAKALEKPAEPMKARSNMGLWFFTLSGQPEDIVGMLKKLENAGIKLASNYVDQHVIRRAQVQWLDLMLRRDEIRAQMASTGMLRARKPNPSPVPSTTNPNQERSAERKRRGKKCAECGLQCN
ncbi:DM7 family protein GM11958 [Drosophila montana]|uniref:DM7 family protein GM11958 n=1 Tax=Drosophila montana TaxID=40370 RepID=UPI00313E298E